MWDLNEITEKGQVHFSLTKGTFKCFQTIVNGYVNEKLNFLRSYIPDNFIDISDLTFSNIKISKNKYHFDFMGDTSVTDSVRFFSFLFYFEYSFFFDLDF